MDVLLGILKDHGPWIAVVAFLLWRASKREDHSAKREDAMGKALDLQSKQMLELTQRFATIAEQNTEAYRQLVRVLRDRPCLLADEYHEVPKSKKTKSDPEIKAHRPSLPETDRLPRVQ